MPILARDSKREYNPAPEGLHQAVCIDVIDLGMQETQWGAKEKVEIRWQLDLEDPDSEGRRFMVMQRYTLSLNQKAKLRHQLEAWRGRKFTKEELAGFDLEKLIGANAQVQVVHNITDNGGIFANVQAIVPLGRGMVKIEAKDYERVKDRDKASQKPGSDPFSEAFEEEDAHEDIPF